jgi:hypothetical protein
MYKKCKVHGLYEISLMCITSSATGRSGNILIHATLSMKRIVQNVEIGM